jgi:hypothetical protein
LRAISLRISPSLLAAGDDIHRYRIRYPPKHCATCRRSEYDRGERHLDLQKLPVFLENQQKGSYKVFLDPGGIGSDAALPCNQSYEADPEIARWLTNVDFRRALSLGIDRDQLKRDETFWLGLGTPGSVACTRVPLRTDGKGRLRLESSQPMSGSCPSPRSPK